MADFHLYRLLRDQRTLAPLGITCEDWTAVRERFAARGRSENEQVVVLHQGLIYAVERKDGNGFAMVYQDRQSSEDQFWYPGWEERKRAFKDQSGLEDPDTASA